MTKIEAITRYSNRHILLNACVGLERYKKTFGVIPNSILDIGAHIGGLTFQAMEQGVPYILAIEADAKNYIDLCENVRRQTKRIGYTGHVECLHRAFHNTDGNTVEIVRIGNGIDYSCQRSMFYSKDAKNVKRHYTTEKVETIDINGIREKLDEFGVDIIDLFKCDIEGAEFMAMPMNVQTKAFLSHVRYIDLELHPWTNQDYYDEDAFYEQHKDFDKNKRTVNQYFEFIRACGFCVPDDMIQNIKHEYLKLTTYNTALCKEYENAVCN